MIYCFKIKIKRQYRQGAGIRIEEHTEYRAIQAPHETAARFIIDWEFQGIVEPDVVTVIFVKSVGIG